MAKVIICMKIMPRDAEINITELETKVKAVFGKHGFNEIKIETEPVAFGLKALKVIFMIEEEKGSPDELETSLNNLEEVSTAEIIDTRRAIG